YGLEERIAFQEFGLPVGRPAPQPPVGAGTPVSPDMPVGPDMPANTDTGASGDRPTTGGTSASADPPGRAAAATDGPRATAGVSA
ncbi:MAG: hypothetical protein V4755_17310, partial [Curtobacterium sp.]